MISEIGFSESSPSGCIASLYPKPSATARAPRLDYGASLPDNNNKPDRLVQVAFTRRLLLPIQWQISRNSMPLAAGSNHALDACDSPPCDREAFRIAEPSCMHICLPAAVLRGVGNSLNLIIMLKARWHLKKFFCSGSPRVRRCGCICNRVGVVLYVTGTTRPIRSPVD